MSRIQVVSWSELSSFRQCPHQHDLRYRQRWTSPETSPALQKGSLWHLVMERHYRALQAGEPIPVQVQDLLYDERSGQQSEAQDIVEWMYRGHVEKWGRDSEWEVLAVEHEAQVGLPGPRQGRSFFRLKMKLDLVVRWQGQLWLVDHKSGRDLPADKELDLDDQFGLYCWALRQLGRPVAGVIYNAARTQRNKGPMTLDDRFARKLLHRTDRELDQIAREAYQTARRAWGAAADGLPPERTPNTDLCRWRCEFVESCLAGRKGYDELAMMTDRGFLVDRSRH